MLFRIFSSFAKWNFRTSDQIVERIIQINDIASSSSTTEWISLLARSKILMLGIDQRLAAQVGFGHQTRRMTGNPPFFFRLQRQPPFVEELHAIAPKFLGGVHRFVGVVHQTFSSAPCSRRDGKAQMLHAITTVWRWPDQRFAQRNLDFFSDDKGVLICTMPVATPQTRHQYAPGYRTRADNPAYVAA